MFEIAELAMAWAREDCWFPAMLTFSLFPFDSIVSAAAGDLVATRLILKAEGVQAATSFPKPKRKIVGRQTLRNF